MDVSNRKFSHQSFKPLMDKSGFFFSFLFFWYSEAISIGWTEAPHVIKVIHFSRARLWLGSFLGYSYTFIRPRVLMLHLLGDCLIWLMLTHWDGSLLYLSARTSTGLQHSAQGRRFHLHDVFTFRAPCFCLPSGSQYITCKLQNCSDGNRGKPFPGFIIPNSLVVQDEYVFIQVGLLLRSLASLNDN